MATTHRPVSQFDVPANVPPYERDPQYGSDVAVAVVTIVAIVQEPQSE